MKSDPEFVPLPAVAGGEAGRRVPGRLPRAQRVGDIEAAARKVFCLRGFGDASMAEIASEAGVAEGTIYKFFRSKRQLFFRVIEVWYEGMLQDFDSNLAGIVGAKNKIRFIIWRHIASLKQDRDLARLCVAEARTGADYYEGQLHELNRRYTHVFVEACREGIASGELNPGMSIPLVRDLVFGGIDHHLLAMLHGRGDVDPGQAADLIVETILGGVGTPVATGDRDNLRIATRVERAAARIERTAARLDGCNIDR